MFTEQLWQEWAAKEEPNYVIKNGKRKYLKKGYLHFDHRFWFPRDKEKLRKILENRLLLKDSRTGRSNYWSFDPLIKMLLKTPRYKYQEAEGHNELETKIRPISFSSHLDSLILGFYAFGLGRLYENHIKKRGFDECVLAYRSDLGSCNIQFSKEVFDYIKSKGPCTAIALDIKGYFDHIDHKILKEKWTEVLGSELPEDQFRIYKSLTKYSYVSKNSILKKYDVNLDKAYETSHPQLLLELIPGDSDKEKFDRLRRDKLVVTNNKVVDKGRTIGIPQGSAMSALLSNIYLLGYDELLHQKSKKDGFLYRRYCDDILIVCETKDAERLQKFAIEHIEDDCHLIIQQKKVELTEFRKNKRGVIRAFNKKKILSDGIDDFTGVSESLYYKSLQYLGFEYNGKDILIRSSSLSRYYRKMKARVEKTISMAYSSKSKSNIISKEQLFRKYTHLGSRNFLTYAYNASKKEYKNSDGVLKEGMNSLAIKKQLRRHFDVLLDTLEKKNDQRYEWKKSKGKVKSKKKI